jgi:hypothetical protein
LFSTTSPVPSSTTLLLSGFCIVARGPYPLSELRSVRRG